MIASRASERPADLADVVLEAGGDHQFDLGHLRRQGAVRLVRLLLTEAGFRRALTWQVRVEKKIMCNGETKPVTVVGSKPWCCYLKIKPGDNDTAHFCSLLMPSGYRGDSVYDALKDVEDRVNRAWRGLEREGDSMTDAPPQDSDEPSPEDRPALTAADRQAAARETARLLFEPPPDAPPNAADVTPPTGGVPTTEPEAADDGAEEEDEPPASELRGWIGDAERLSLTLSAIDEVGREGGATDLTEFVAALAGKLGWQALRRKQIGGIFTALVRRGLIRKVRRGDHPHGHPLGYALTDEGRRLAHDLLPSDAAAAGLNGSAPPAATPPAGRPSAMLADGAARLDRMARLVERFRTGSQRLREIAARRAQLDEEIRRLDAEAADLIRFVEDPALEALMDQLDERACPGHRSGRGTGAGKTGETRTA